MTLGGAGIGAAGLQGITGLGDAGMHGGVAAAAPTYNNPPVVVAAQGTVAATTTSGTVIPPSVLTNDIEVLISESAGGEPISWTDLAGFTEFPNSPQATGALTAGTRINAYWRRATADGVGASPAYNDPGDHQGNRILAYRGVKTSGVPYDVTAGDVKAAASVAVQAPGVTTTVPNCLILNLFTHDLDVTGDQFSAQANASLVSVTEQMTMSYTAGNGGGICACVGVKTTAGVVDPTTATVTSSVNAMMTIALVPAS